VEEFDARDADERVGDRARAVSLDLRALDDERGPRRLPDRLGAAVARCHAPDLGDGARGRPRARRRCGEGLRLRAQRDGGDDEHGERAAHSGGEHGNTDLFAR
jgi:hypothetical protein